MQGATALFKASQRGAHPDQNNNAHGLNAATHSLNQDVLPVSEVTPVPIEALGSIQNRNQVSHQEYPVDDGA